jgi:hypothetical protein
MASATPLRLWITAVALAVACAAFGGRLGRAAAPSPARPQALAVAPVPSASAGAAH